MPKSLMPAKHFVSLFILITSLYSVAQAQIISTRSELNSQLGAFAITEDFESWSGDSLSPADFATLDSSTIVSGQGPGIVNSGLLFSNINSKRNMNELQLDRRASFGIASGALLAEGGTLVADFINPVTHFGLNLFQFSGYSDSAIVRVFGSDDSTLLFTSSPLSAPNAPASTFFGYTENSGIGRITLESSTNVWSPIADNLTYGTIATPEPSSLLIFAVLGCIYVAHRARKR